MVTGRYWPRRVHHACQLPASEPQVPRTSWAPLAAVMDVGDRHSEPCWSSIPRGLMDTFSVHLCEAPPLQVQSWILVPLVVPSPVSSRHLPLARMVPSGSSVHFWGLPPLQ